MKKRTKVFLLSVIALMMTLLSGTFSETYAASPWDGKTIDVRWFDETSYDTTTEYTISTPEELMGLAAIVNGIYNPGIKVIGDDQKTKIVPVEYKNVLIIPFDGTRGNIRWGKYDFEGKTIKLDADLDMGGIYNSDTKTWDPNSPNYMPIGGSYSMASNNPRTTLISSVFNGSFNGQGHRIDNIYFERYAPDHFGYSQALGFIGATGFNGKVKEIDELKDKEFPMPKGGTAIQNITIGKGYMSGRRMVGGIVGRVGSSINGTKITNCSNEAEIVGTDKKGVGGIVGALLSKDSVVSYCYNKGNVTNTGNFIVAGIVGALEGRVENCYNVGIVKSYNIKTGQATDKTAAADIAKVTNGNLSYAENCYWEEREDNKGRIGVSLYGSVGGTVEKCEEKTPAYMKSQSFVTLLNSKLQSFEYVSGDYPKLKFEGTNSNVSVTLKVSGGVQVLASHSGSVKYGTKIDLNISEVPGKVVDYFTINGVKIEGNSVIADKNMEISVVTKAPKEYTLKLPAIDPEYSIQVLKTGIQLENGVYLKVEKKQVYTGEKVFDGDILTINKSIAEGNANVRLILETVKGAEKDNDVMYVPYYKVTTKSAEENGNNVDVTIQKYAHEENWNKYADTAWYDKNPDASVFEIKNHQELAGLSKIMNDTTAKYKTVTFKGKTINLTTDIRFRNDKAQFEGENLPLTPIGNIRPFEGTFDGKNHRVSHVIINDDTGENSIGLFAKVFGTSDNPAVIKNLEVDGKYTVEKGGLPIGGIIGESKHVNIKNVKAYVDIDSKRETSTGGVVGSAVSTAIETVQNTGNIKTERGNIGGVAGSIDGNSSINQALNTGSIYQGPLSFSFVPYSTGGIVGDSHGKINNVANKGRVVGYFWTGGIAGHLKNSINDAYSTGEVVTLGSYNSNSSVGTLIGNISLPSDALFNSYTTGKLNSRLSFNSNKGYVGLKTDATKIFNSHYLESTIDSIQMLTNVESKAEEEMKTAGFTGKLGSNFAMDTYHINNGFPVLKFENGLMDSISIEDLRKQNKDEIEMYPIKEYYDEENYKKVQALTDEYLKKFDRYNNSLPNTATVKTEMRTIVNEFKQKVDQIPKINVNEDEIARELLDNILIQSIKEMEDRLASSKLPVTDNIPKAKAVLSNAKSVSQNENATDFEVREASNQIFDTLKLIPLDNEAPIIYNLDPVTIKKGTPFNPLKGVIVRDNYFGAPEPKLTVQGSVDTNKLGKQQLIYIAEDSVGNRIEQKRTISVVQSDVDPSKYDINGDGNVNMRDIVILQKAVKIGMNYEESSKKYDLNNDKKINIRDLAILEKFIKTN